MTSPLQGEAPRRRLARLMDERRDELELLWNDVAKLAGLTREGLRTVRVGNRNIKPETRRGIERALQWERGSVRAILSGGEPTPLESAEQQPEPEPAPRESQQPEQQPDKPAPSATDDLPEDPDERLAELIRRGEELFAEIREVLGDREHRRNAS